MNKNILNGNLPLIYRIFILLHKLQYSYFCICKSRFLMHENKKISLLHMLWLIAKWKTSLMLSRIVVRKFQNDFVFMYHMLTDISCVLFYHFCDKHVLHLLICMSAWSRKLDMYSFLIDLSICSTLLHW